MRKAGLIAAVGATLAIAASPAAAKPGDIIVGDSGAGQVLRVDPRTGDSQVVSDDSRFANPNDSVVAPDGSLFVADYGSVGKPPRIFRVNPKTGDATVFAESADFDTPDGLARAPSGELFATDLFADSSGAVFDIGVPGGEFVETFSGPELHEPLGVVVPPNGKPLVANFSSPPRITEVDPSTGDLRTIADPSDGLGGVGGLARAPDGALYIVDYDDEELEAVDPRTGDVRVVATGFVTDGYGLAIDFQGRVIGQFDDEIRRANPRTGATDTVATGLGYAEGFEVEPPKCKGKTATIVGSNKKDRLKGSKFRDVIASLKGRDQLKGGKGKDFLCAGKAKDKVKAAERKPKRDKVNCGTGNDKVIVDLKDKVARNCEEVVVG